MILRMMMTTSLIALSSCQSFNKFIGIKDDNPIEIFCESMIESVTNIKFDLTPDYLDYDKDDPINRNENKQMDIDTSSGQDDLGM